MERGRGEGSSLYFLIPIGFLDALDAFGMPLLVLAGIGVGICSLIIPYVCDQMAMSRLPRASFALLLTLLPTTATIVGVVVLRQIPVFIDLAGVALVMLGVAIYPSPRVLLRPLSMYTMLLAYCAGLRRGELAWLDLGDVDLRDGTITVRQTKFFKTRILPLPDRVVDELRAYVDARGRAGGSQDARSGLARARRRSLHAGNGHVVAL